MNNNVKLTIISLFISCLSIAQNNTNSPYSRFGIGDIAIAGFSRNHGMGGIAIGLRSSGYINYLNPASYSAQDSMSFLFDFGMMNSSTEFKSTGVNGKSKTGNIHHLALAFPVNRWWSTSCGLMPYSDVGYNIEENRTEGGVESNILFRGSGAISQFYIGNSFKVTRKFSLGINASYMFGSINQSKIVTLPEISGSSYLLINDSKSIGGFICNFGLQFSDKLHENSEYTIGIIMNTKTNLESKSEQIAINYVYNNSQDTIYNFSNPNGQFLFPLNIGMGFAINNNNTLIYGIDYIWQKWENISNLSPGEYLTNSSAIKAGLEYTPDRYAGANFFKRLSYRTGGYYENTYLTINDTQIKKYGMSFGLGIPVKHSSINIAFEMGKRGTTDNSLIQENYKIFTFSLSLYDYWFIKRKFD